VPSGTATYPKCDWNTVPVYVIQSSNIFKSISNYVFITYTYLELLLRSYLEEKVAAPV
jgi:hypothetical protein